MHKTKIIIVGVLVGIITVIGVNKLLPMTVGVIDEAATSQEGLRSQLLRMSAQLNGYLPIMVDEETRLVSTASGDRKFRYNYMLVNHSVEQIDAESLKTRMRDKILIQVCTKEEMELFRKYNVKVSYAYSDKDGVEITMITVRPEECSHP